MPSVPSSSACPPPTAPSSSNRRASTSPNIRAARITPTSGAPQKMRNPVSPRAKWSRRIIARNERRRENPLALIHPLNYSHPMKTTKASRTHRLYSALLNLGFTFPECSTLIRASNTLSRWSEAECNGDIQRDEVTGKPWRYYGPEYYHKCPTSDREAGALRRIAAICKRAGVHFYHQQDPRGCALYVSSDPLTDQTYHRAVAVTI